MSHVMMTKDNNMRVRLIIRTSITTQNKTIPRSEITNCTILEHLSTS